MKKHLLISLAIILVAGARIETKAQTLVPEVQTTAYFDVSKPLTEMSPLDNSLVKQWKKGIVKNRFRYKKNGTPDAKIIAPFIQVEQGLIKSKAPSVNIEGCNNGDNDSGVAPPDTQGDVGPNHYVQMVNNVTEIFDKNGNSIWGPQNSSVFWDGFTGAWTGTNDGDPIVLYDQAADRWLVSQFAVNTSNGTQWELIAVSTSPDPTGTYYRYAFQFTDMPDYPKLGIWHDGYYLSANRFLTSSWAFNGVYACALDRSAMLSGNASAQMIKFDLAASADPYAMLPSDCDGDFPPAGTPNYFCYDTDDNTYWSVDRVKVWAFTANWVTPANSTFVEVASLTPTSFNSAFSDQNGEAIDQPSTTQDLHTLSDRMMFRSQYRYFPTHQSIVLSRTVNLGSDQAAIRWYELRRTTGSWSIYQQGTYAPDANSRWMSSIAMNGSGDIALGYSVSGASTFPSIRYTGRRDGDALGTMTITEESIFSGTASQTGVERWGDYSMMSVDPSDDNAFWYTQEYSAGGWDWRTRIAKFNFPSGDEPGSFTAVPFSSTQIDLSWNLNNNNDNVLVAWSSDGNFGTPIDGTVYSASQSITGGGTVLQYGSNTAYNHTGLTPSTTYYYKAWSYNGTDYTEGVTTNAATLCGSINTFPWTEDFEGAFLPNCWSKYVPGSGNDITKESAQNHTTGGTYSARFSSYSSSSDYNQYLFSPQIHVPSSGQLSFWHRKSGNYAELLQYGISTTTNPDDYTWTSVTLSYTAWQQTTVDLSAYVGQDVYVGFHYFGNYLYYVYLDDVQITGISIPTASVSVNAGCNTGSVTVTSDQSGTQTFYLRDDSGNPISDWTGDATNHEFTGYADGTYRGQVEKAGLMSGLSSPIVLTNHTAPVAPATVYADATEICESETTNLNYTGGYGQTFKWYTGSCGSTYVGSGNALPVNPTVTTTYYGRWENVCGESTCLEVTVNVNPLPESPSNVNVSDNNICSGEAVTLSYSGGSGDSFEWYSGTCGGTSVGSGNDLSVSPDQTTTYYGRWENACDDSDCLSVIVAVGIETSITDQPDNVNANVGENVQFTVTAAGESLSYQWRFNETNIDNAISNTYSITNVQTLNAGNYDVVVTGNCGEEISNTAILTVSTSIEELMEIGIQIFPNPSNGIVNVVFMNEIKNATCKISDITGKLILQQTMRKKDNRIKLEGVDKGIYFIEIIMDNQSYLTKIIVE
jgi:hypothetical protein